MIWLVKKFKLGSSYLALGLVPVSSYIFTPVGHHFPVRRKEKQLLPTYTHTRICALSTVSSNFPLQACMGVAFSSNTILQNINV